MKPTESPAPSATSLRVSRSSRRRSRSRCPRETPLPSSAFDRAASPLANPAPLPEFQYW